jgi:hypothetical protein
MSAGSNIKPQDVEGLIELFKSSNWDEMHVQVGEFELFLSNDPKATGPGRAVAAAPAAAPALTAAAPVAVGVARSPKVDVNAVESMTNGRSHW